MVLPFVLKQLLKNTVMKKILLSMSLLLALPTMTFAGPRSIEEMKAAAQKAIPAAQGNARSVVRGELKVLKAASQLTVLGYQNGGYAVIANDDAHEAVLGYSQSRYADSMPCGLKWWMKATDIALQRGEATSDKTAEIKEIRGMQLFFSASKRYRVCLKMCIFVTVDTKSIYNLLFIYISNHEKIITDSILDSPGRRTTGRRAATGTRGTTTGRNLLQRGLRRTEKKRSAAHPDRHIRRAPHNRQAQRDE